MKRFTSIFIAVITVLGMLFSVFPTGTALAKKDASDVTVSFRNRTGGEVTVTLFDENGNGSTLSSGPGVFSFTVPQGTYSFHAVTLCGNQSGQFNLNVNKILLLSCDDGLEIALTKPHTYTCEPLLWVGVDNWYELNSEWTDYLTSDPFWQAEVKCYDGVSTTIFTPYEGGGD